MSVVGGESLIDFIERPGAGQNPLYEAFPGGSPYNCALAMARLGAPSGFCGPFSHDRLGVFMREHLQASGAHVVLGEPSPRPSSLAIVSLGTDGQASYRFEREGTAEHDIDADRVMAAMPAEANVFHTGSLAIVLDADAAVWRQVAERV